FQMAPDGKSLLMDTDKVIHQSRGSEANKLYKNNGLYYHFFSEVHGEGRVVMMERARSLDGPWEIKQLNHVSAQVDKEPNQGGLIGLPDERWEFFTHQGRGDWEGRAACLLPVTWMDGWPILGKVGPDGIGGMVWRAEKPISGFPRTEIQESDDFTTKTLKPSWEWNYQPRAGKWSLTERPGALRLRAFRPLTPGDFKKAGDTLTQRVMRTPQNVVTVKLELAGMADGQQAGMAHYAKTWCTFGITQSGTVRTLTYTVNGQVTPGPAVTQDALWLRSEWGFDGQSQFSYSLDGKTFTPFGPVYQLTWGDYRGDRVGIFTFNDRGENGYVDVDSFQYTVSRSASQN
ncbi:MAG: family 43 glycosylhydrolase, partial [Armatimonadota bacterium]|nr:family 43 glycosylhydrolase [Armatimonadota bacterium]